MDVVETTRFLRGRSTTPSHNLVPIRADGFGNYDCLDLSRPTQSGESMIVFRSHDSKTAIEDIAGAYFDWVLGALELAKN